MTDGFKAAVEMRKSCHSIKSIFHHFFGLSRIEKKQSKVLNQNNGRTD
jgi:hypothetical protein